MEVEAVLAGMNIQCQMQLQVQPVKLEVMAALMVKTAPVVQEIQSARVAAAATVRMPSIVMVALALLVTVSQGLRPPDRLVMVV